MLHTAAVLSLAVALLSAAIIAADETRHPQPMSIMNIVWPSTALYFGPFALWAYFAKGRPMASMPHMHHHQPEPAHTNHPAPPSLAQTALATSHCGAGCVLADIVTETLVSQAHLTLFGRPLYASYLYDFLAASLLGIAFQYFAIRPMQQLSATHALLAALKADIASITAFQTGMYACMALFSLKLLPGLHPTQPEYWLTMQLAMICGFITALPVNWLLVRMGVKESMG